MRSTYFALISLFGQNDGANLWQDVAETNIQSLVDDRWIIPKKYRTLQLDRSAFETILDQSPNQNNLVGATSIIAIPLPDGTAQQFAVVASAIMDAKLAAKFPEIKTYYGKGVDDPQASIYLDMTPQGFHGMILSPSGTVFIDPYYKQSDDYYVAYYKSNFSSSDSIPWSCEVIIPEEEKLVTDEQKIRDQEVPLANARLATVNMRKYRIAIAANGEYTTFHGGTVALGQAAIVTALNRVRGVYENEVAVSFELVANNSSVVYTNAGTDPFSNTSDAIDEIKAELDTKIGFANYDVGHVFTTGSGGVASLGGICSTRKANGTTGLPNPTNDPFYIDYVAHELGHQFGGNHTFNGDSGSCSGANRNGSTAYEPGSGSTIQAYAGICGNDNIQNNSDPYFHLISLNEIRAHVTGGSGGTCGIVEAANTKPVVNANLEQVDGKTIPESTPFELTGSASDPDGDNLTYNWEEWDLGLQSDINSPGVNAPLFRTFEPDNDSTRIFPKLTNILNNTSTIGEALPTVGRTLRFQFIARDDNQVGAYSAGMITLNVADGTGPFKINTPNTAGMLSGTTTVTWDVAGTTANPINCGEVDIYLSTDGGQTFTDLLVDNTANDGSAEVILPNINSATARLKVKCADNVFFDINDTNFSIQPAGATNCAITSITAGSATNCDGDKNQYTRQVTVNYNNPPASGNLVVNGQAFAFTGSPQTVTLTGLNADGKSVNVIAAFSDHFACSFSVSDLFTAPSPCVEQACMEYASADIPKTISSSGTPTITSTIAVNQTGPIASVKIKNLNGQHTYVSDLTFKLNSPSGTTVNLFGGVCANLNNFNLNFDDDGAENPSIACPPTGGALHQPESPFSIFENQSAIGTWTLTVSDAFNQDGGSLDGWTLEVCTFNEVYFPTVAFNSTSSNGSESVSATNIPVNLSTASASSIMVDYTVTGTASGNGTDYTLANGTLTFDAGSTSENITIASIIDDVIDETNETVILTLSNPANASLGTNTVHTYTINDNDDVPTVAFNSTSSDGLESVSSTNLQVDLTAASALSVTVDYAVTGAASGSGTDYTLANGTLTFNAGSTSENITIASIIDDVIDETNETVIVTLSNPINASLGTNTVHTYTINDNDDPTNCSLSSITLDQDPIPTNTYVSGGTISSAGIVAINTNIGFQAKTAITLGVGFHAVEGSTFLAQIVDCTPPSFQETPSSNLRNSANNPLKNQQSITAVNIYPNPFTYTTTIAYQLNEVTDLTIRLFDLSGKEMQRLLIGDKNTPGHHQLQLNASQLSKGMYLLYFQTKEIVITKKLVVQQ